MDKLILMPSPECKEGLVCTLDEMRAELREWQVLWKGGYGRRAYPHRVLYYNHGFGVEAKVGSHLRLIYL